MSIEPVTAESFEEWKHHPVTKRFMKMLQTDREAMKEGLINNAFEEEAEVKGRTEVADAAGIVFTGNMEDATVFGLSCIAGIMEDAIIPFDLLRTEAPTGSSGGCGSFVGLNAISSFLFLADCGVGSSAILYNTLNIIS